MASSTALILVSPRTLIRDEPTVTVLILPWILTDCLSFSHGGTTSRPLLLALLPGRAGRPDRNAGNSRPATTVFAPAYPTYFTAAKDRAIVVLPLTDRRTDVSPSTAKGFSPCRNLNFPFRPRIQLQPTDLGGSPLAGTQIRLRQHHALCKVNVLSAAGEIRPSHSYVLLFFAQIAGIRSAKAPILTRYCRGKI